MAQSPVLTLKDVISSMATKIGRTIARLLNYGFPVGAATNLIQDTMFSGEHYAVVGDSNAAVTQTTGGTPEVLKVRGHDDEKLELTIETFASWNYGAGSMLTPYLGSVNRRFIVPGKFGPWISDETVLSDYIDYKQMPIIAAGEFYWPRDVSVAEICEALQD